MENYQKIKLLKIYEILSWQTDEMHPLTTSKLICKLNEMHITCDRRTLYKDIALLNQFGYDIISVKSGKENAYYFAERKFSIPELRILIDAVHSTKFITEKKSEELVTKIAQLAGKAEAEELISHSTLYNTCKHTNEAVYYNIDAVEDALRNSLQVSFFYYDLDENRNRVYRRNKERYIVDPIALMVQDEKYYLLTYSKKYDSNVTYRLDRMDCVQVEENVICKKAEKSKENLSDYTGAVYNMYTGKKTTIRIEFVNDLLGVIYDQYGENIHVKRVTAEKCQCDIEVEISPTFWGWLFQFADKMKIISPKKVKEEYKSLCQRCIDSQ